MIELGKIVARRMDVRRRGHTSGKRFSLIVVNGVVNHEVCRGYESVANAVTVDVY